MFANPSGTYTEERYATAQWVHKDGKLASIDTSLESDGRGRFNAKATEVAVSLSGGGSGPLATVTRDGRSISLAWPKALPTPEVDGDTATYPNVLPDVDLKVRADPAGFGQLLVVKTPEAATNPDLATLQYSMASNGVDVSVDEHDNLRAVNPAGQEVFTGPTPRMWDSTTEPAGQPAAKVPASASPPTQGARNDDEFIPGPGAKQAPVQIDVHGKSLQLTPDQELLKGKDTKYPLYIDPYIEGSRYAWTIAYEKYPNSAFYNGAGWIERDGKKGTTTARVGYENETNGLGRSYFRMNTKNLWSTNKKVLHSTFRIMNKWSWSCSSRPVDMYRTDTISSATTWNNQPAKRGKLDTVNDAKGWGTGCPAGNLAFDTTTAAKDAASGHWNTITLLLQAADESDVYGWKKFDAKSAVLSTEYNTVPNAPTGLYTHPSSGSKCGATAPYTVIGNTDITLGAKFGDRDGGTVKAQFVLWPTGHGGADNEVRKTISVTSNTLGKLVVPKATLTSLLKNAGVAGTGTFSWWAQTSDGSLVSAWSPQCHFQFDATRPSHPPTVTSPQFPDGSDGWPAVTGSVRSPGTFTVASGGVSDVVSYTYWTETDDTRRTTKPATTGGSATLALTPTLTGANQLYVQSSDRAGNRSDTTTYLFYANGPKQPDKPGDLNGDGNADLWGVDKDGTLHRFYGSGNGTLTEANATASQATWNNTKITHRGDWTSDGYEDLISLSNDPALGAQRLWVQPNNGYGYACTDCSGDGTQRQELTVYDEANNHWKNGAKQILAVGDVDGPLDTNGDGTPDTPGYPDLVVNDGTYVWLYYGGPDYRLDTEAAPVLLGGPDDPLAEGASKISEITLAAAGDWNADGTPDLVARYDRADAGGLYVFNATKEDGDYGISLSHRTPIGPNFSTTTVPTFTAAPDANNNGKLDLWATTPNSGRLRAFLDLTSTGTGQVISASENFAGYQTIS
ncbi:hypothetical protein HEK616_50330 [Streptomyces nigrescens]|uniref:Large secreted protein n=1 Tax=Streptomyces nigrescens TaxID=1920 RepID=A0ABN6R3P7_STRNI|nr:FG-GAP-like repeat-containing protein [Streptomyces nigrescens]BDM71546.1 hypothetical protein HEK616_50330 [Streptomyces nigrescens]